MTFTSKETLEFLGTKEKFCTRKDEQEYLFKIGRKDTLENCSEKVAYEIAELIELPCAEYEFAIYSNGEKKQGTASKKLVQDNSRLILGNEILSNFIDNYDTNARQNELQGVLALMRLTKSL